MKRALLIAVVLLALGTTNAQALMQSASLEATGTIQKWESHSFAGVLHLRLYIDGVEVEQVAAQNCNGRYEGQGLYVWVRVPHCAKASAAYLLRYVSASGPQRFTVRLTRN